MVLINDVEVQVVFDVYKVVTPILLFFLASIWNRNDLLNFVMKCVLWLLTIVGIAQWFIKLV